MSGTQNTGISMLDLYKAFTPMIASQLLCAYYAYLHHIRAGAELALAHRLNSGSHIRFAR